MTKNAGDDLRLGFLTTLDVDQKGLVGGLLITNRFGRPLEFQCTAPIKASRTQEILYGQTLRPYLKCDLIGKTLYEKASVKPHVVLTEDPELLDLREQLKIPVACCDEAKGNSGAPNGKVLIGGQILSFHSSHNTDLDKVNDHAESLPNDADLAEPLERVREALSETAKSGP
ncbi:MAG: hypothetical protein AB8G99_02450 [Planctomycetaceae bacterium]